MSTFGLFLWAWNRQILEVLFLNLLNLFFKDMLHNIVIERRKVGDVGKYPSVQNLSYRWLLMIALIKIVINPTTTLYFSLT